MTDWLVRVDRRLLPPLARVLYRLVGGPVAARMFTVLGLTAALAATLTAAWVANRQRPASAPGPLVRVGPADGQAVEEYARLSRARLDGLLHGGTAGSQEVYALVAFTGYLAPDRFTAIVGGVPVPWTYMRARVPDARTAPVRMATYRLPADVTLAMDRVAQRKQEQAAAAERMLRGTTGDTVSSRQARARYRTEALTAAGEAAAFRQHCSCVFAAVVQATPAALDAIAHRPGVRVVDPADRVLRLDRAVFNPPLPEQTIAASGGARQGFDTIAATAPPRPVPARQVIVRLAGQAGVGLSRVTVLSPHRRAGRVVLISFGP